MCSSDLFAVESDAFLPENGRASVLTFDGDVAYQVEGRAAENQKRRQSYVCGSFKAFADRRHPVNDHGFLDFSGRESPPIVKRRVFRVCLNFHSVMAGMEISRCHGLTVMWITGCG